MITFGGFSFSFLVSGYHHKGYQLYVCLHPPKYSPLDEPWGCHVGGCRIWRVILTVALSGDLNCLASMAWENGLQCLHQYKSNFNVWPPGGLGKWAPMTLSIQLRWVRSQGDWESSEARSSSQWQGYVVRVQTPWLSCKTQSDSSNSCFDALEDRATWSVVST